VRQCLTRSGAFLDEAIRPAISRVALHATITYLDKPQMDAILASPDRNSPQGRRDYALLLFLYNSGARASEAANLRNGDVDWHGHSVRLLGKGNKQRTCPL
jgi:site-specific recombinase XerD